MVSFCSSIIWNNIDICLRLGDSTQFVETRLKSNKGAGANAGRKGQPFLDSGNQIESLNNDKMDLTSDSNVMQHHPDDEENNLRNIIISSGTAISDYNAFVKMLLHYEKKLKTMLLVNVIV
ncbi:hypothetical protein Leryth_025871 [Lithospermum erythrorhizon]|nr:hypothetical protein Leryth_025871 [Lithospermum erythrorhizon]